MVKRNESKPETNPITDHSPSLEVADASSISAKVETLFGDYVERMMSGEILDLQQIENDHPECGAELVQQLRSFQELAKPSNDLNGKSIGEYNVVRLLGRGGMGIVYEGWQNNLERRVAIKILPTGITADPRSIARFTQEAQLAAKLNHPNIVTVFGMGVEKDIPYFVMEYVEGQTLAQFLKPLKKNRTEQIAPPQDNLETVAHYAPNESTQGLDHRRLNLEYFLRMAKAFASVADGLHHAHEQGVIHRDIKPSNLMVEITTDEDGKETQRLRLLDFGLARFEGQETFTRTGDVLGTLLYMSPEQAIAGSSSKLDTRTDIYSLGVSFYEARPN